MKLKNFFIFLLLFSAALAVVVYFFANRSPSSILSPLSLNSSLSAPTKKPTKYSPYTFNSLSQRKFSPGEIKLGAATRKQKAYTTYIFTYKTDSKTVSGMANIPNQEGKFPVIVLLRGYADKENYHIGLGTEKSANFLAEHGFLTLAPDFLGYGYSDWEDEDILLARFYRPVEVLNLLASISSLPQADPQRIGFWGHSNGGQIALSVLEITGHPYPTSLWAPVSLGFPESVLVYLGTEEVGNPVKEKIEEFLKENDPKEYSIANFFPKITSPFIIHQAENDEMIKTKWTDNLVNQLRSQGLSVEYYLYPKENHNFNRFPKTGDLLRARDLVFFEKYLKNQ